MHGPWAMGIYIDTYTHPWVYDLDDDDKRYIKTLK